MTEGLITTDVIIELLRKIALNSSSSEGLTPAQEVILNSIATNTANTNNFLSDGIESIWKDENNVIFIRRSVFQENTQTWTITTVLPNGTNYIPVGTIIPYNKESILNDYSISRTDSVPIIKYFGFVNTLGEWYILKQDTTLVVETFTYFKGTIDFLTNWTNRVSLAYDEFENIF